MFRPRKRAVMIVTLAFTSMPAAGLATEVPTAYDCRFVDGGSWSFAARAFKAGTVAPLDFKVTGLSLETLAARIESERGTADVKVMQGLGARHLIEVAVEGFLNITTIYDERMADGGQAAVHSRHLGLFGAPMVAQYRGSCRGVD